MGHLSLSCTRSIILQILFVELPQVFLVTLVHMIEQRFAPLLAEHVLVRDMCLVGYDSIGGGHCLLQVIIESLDSVFKFRQVVLEYDGLIVAF